MAKSEINIPNSKSPSTYGNWSSDISTDLITGDSISIDESRLSKNALYFIECRPLQAGRCVIVKQDNDGKSDILAAPYSARSRVHEYGGGCYCIGSSESGADIIFFVNDADQDIYRISGNSIDRITSDKNRRFADFIFDHKNFQLISVCEQHNSDGIINSIVSINLANGDIQPLLQGCDFYAGPRLNSTATQLCWQSWNHPNMPWDGNQLWLANFNAEAAPEQRLKNRQCIAGGNDISTFQPQWSVDDILYFISDDTGWWHLYRYLNNKVQQLSHGEKEFGLPQWVFAQSSYAFLDNNTIICSYQSAGETFLATLPLKQKTILHNLNTPWQNFSSISACQNKFSFIAAPPRQFPQLYSATLNTSVEDTDTNPLRTSTIQSSCKLSLADDYYSIAQNITFNNRYQQPVYAHYYPPFNPAYRQQQSTPPPLIVLCHGGPSGQSGTALDPKKQFWTSRGFAILDVNYSGSTGYGRAYRRRLEQRWGLLDVQDCCDAALYAVAQGLADAEKLIIRGSSAGGFTVLSALTFEQVFSAGASYYGISELTSLARDTHKFESHYLDRLIGPYPEAADIYRQRSPINHTEMLQCPVIFFQGEEDRVVPRQQAEKMFTALDKKAVPVAAQYFAGEQHGFRNADTVKQALENELSFYQLVLDLKPADEINFKGEIQLSKL